MMIFTKPPYYLFYVLATPTPGEVVTTSLRIATLTFNFFSDYLDSKNTTFYHDLRIREQTNLTDLKRLIKIYFRYSCEM